MACGVSGNGDDEHGTLTLRITACTAVVTEISYHNKANIEADVTFLSEEEWRQELGILLQDLFDEDSGQIKRVNDLKSEAGVAWSKVRDF